MLVMRDDSGFMQLLRQPRQTGALADLAVTGESRIVAPVSCQHSAEAKSKQENITLFWNRKDHETV